MDTQEDPYPKVWNLKTFNIVMVSIGSVSLIVAFISLLNRAALGLVIGISIAFYAWVIYYLVNKPNKTRRETWQRHCHEYLVARNNLYRFIAASENFALEQLVIRGEENQRRFERATSKMMENALELIPQDQAIETALDEHDPFVDEPLTYYRRNAQLIWHQWQHVKMNAAFWSGSSHLDEAIAPLGEGLKEAKVRIMLLQHHIPVEARYFFEDRSDELSAAIRTIEQATDALQRKENRAEHEKLLVAMVDALRCGTEATEAILSHLKLLEHVHVVSPQNPDGTIATLPDERTRLESEDYVRLRQGLYRINATFAQMKPHPDYDFTRIDREISPFALRFNRFWRWWQKFREIEVLERISVLMMATFAVLFTILGIELIESGPSSKNDFNISMVLTLINAGIFFFVARHFSDRLAESYIQASIFRSTDSALELLHENLSEMMLGLDDERLRSLVLFQTFEAEGEWPRVLTGDKRQALKEEALADAWRETLELKSMPQSDKDYRYIERVEALDAQVVDLMHNRPGRI